jgi:hypothetical protein
MYPGFTQLTVARPLGLRAAAGLLTIAYPAAMEGLS